MGKQPGRRAAGKAAAPRRASSNARAVSDQRLITIRAQDDKLVPGLSGQSAVSNNHEIDRLRLGPCAVDPHYYAVQSNFETTVGWKFWKIFRKDVIADAATNVIFDGPNDLVVDTMSMIDLGVPNLQLAGPAKNFGTTDTVWHCNYFRQPETIAYITEKFT